MGERSRRIALLPLDRRQLAIQKCAARRAVIAAVCAYRVIGPASARGGAGIGQRCSATRNFNTSTRRAISVNAGSAAIAASNAAIASASRLSARLASPRPTSAEDLPPDARERDRNAPMPPSDRGVRARPTRG